MTLIIASKCKDGLVLGSDSRSISTDGGARYIRDATDKLIKLNDYSCILIAGDSQASVRLVEEFKKEVKSDDTASSISKKFSKFCRTEYEPYAQNIILMKNSPELYFILAGLDKDNSGKNTIPRIFTIRRDDWFFVGEDREYSIVGKDDISNYLFSKKYDEYSVSSEKMTELIVQCLYDTENIDGESGGKMHLVSITEYGVSETDEKTYIERIEQRDLVSIMESNISVVSEDK